MSNYVQSTNFATKDALPSGDPLKIVKGTEINTEFNNIATAVATKADLASPTFTGTPAAPTASSGTNSTQLATTAFVKTAIDNYDAALTVSTAQIEDLAVTTAKLADTAVTTAKITDANVTSAKLANGAATGAKLGSDAVVTSGDQTVGGTKTFTNGVRFNDTTTQTTAAVTPSTALDGVGSYAVLMMAANNNLAIGGTIAGSSLRYNYTAGGQSSPNNPFFGRVGPGSPSSYNGGGTAVSGTWRKMSSGTVYFTEPDGYGGTLYSWSPALYVRIS